jgi:hypothetical protein
MEHGLKWTHVDYKGNGHLGIVTYEFRPWSKKRVYEKLEIAKQILSECKNNSNQSIERTVNPPAE